jgi:hypothetical protein
MSTYWRGAYLDDRMAEQMDEVVRLCGPDVNIRPTQGSYSGGVAASGGTHDGGGAIDLAGQDAGMTQMDRETIRNAGRSVGLAMWIRDPSQSDWPWHIHGISVQEGGKWDQGCLSSGAHGQVVDYYEGRNGLASGAADDGPRDYVGVTWETYGGASPEAPPPPPIMEDTVASVRVNGQLNIFVIDSSGGIQQNIAGETAWTGWLQGIPGQWAKGLSATADDEGNLSLVGIGSDGVTVQQAWSTPDGWYGPVPFPGVESI